MDTKAQVDGLVNASMGRVGPLRKSDSSRDEALRATFSTLWGDAIDRTAKLTEAGTALHTHMSSLLTLLEGHGVEAPLNELGEVQHLGCLVDRLVGEVCAVKKNIHKIEADSLASSE